MTDLLTPGSEAELAEIVRAAAASGAPIEILGGGTRRDVGRPVQAERTLSTRALDKVSLYEPGALTLVAEAGAKLADIETLLAAEGQRLPFEPGDWRKLLGSSGAPTLGGAVASNLSGPRRIQAGACRDSLIGVRFVNGLGVAVKNGGRVMKNVTGYDLVKLLCGSHGGLGVLTEVAFKLLPAPERAATLTIAGLDDAQAIEALSAALGSPYDVTGAAHLPAKAAAGGGHAETMIRIEGFAGAVAHRAAKLKEALGGYGPIAIEEDPAAVAAGWTRIRDVLPFADREGAVWRISVKPSDGPALVARLRSEIGADAFYDWGGGLVWLLTAETADAGAAAIRAAVDATRGHATLIRAGAAVRGAVPVFHPEPPRLAQITRGLKEAFDPKGVLNPGRMAA